MGYSSCPFAGENLLCPPALSSNPDSPQLCCVCSMGDSTITVTQPASLTQGLLLLWGHRESLNPAATQFPQL